MANNFFKIDRGLSVTPQGTTPTNPQNGDIYYDETLNIFRRYENGAWKSFSTGGGAKSYAIENDSTADDALGSNWTTADVTAYPPTSYSGGTVTATLARTTSSPLQGNGSMLFTPGGQYDSAVFTFPNGIDRADFARMHKIEFDYEIGTYANYTDGDVKLAVVCASDSGFTTDLQVIQPAGHSILKVAGQETHVATFQSHASNIYYKIFLVQTTASTGYTLKLDNFKVGPQSVAYGCPVTDVKSYTPTWTASTPPAIGNGTIQGWWTRNGDKMEIDIDIITGTTTTYGTGSWSFSLPSGYSIDTSKLGSQFAAVLGNAQAHITVSSNIYDGIVYRNDATSVAIFATSGVGATSWQSNSPATWSGSTANQRIGLKFSVPILGWSSNVVISDSADTRVVSFRGTNGSTQSLTAGTTKIAVTATKDSNGGWDGDEYTISVPGDYFVTLKSGDNSGATVGFDAYVDGSNFGRIHNSYATSAGENGSGSILIPGLLAGQKIDLRCNSSITAAPSSISIFRISGPAQIAASESVNLRVKTSSSQTITTATETKIIYDSVDYDSHGSFNTSTSLFTAPKPAKYHISATVGMNTSGYTAGQLHIVYIQKNGGTNGIQLARQYPPTANVNIVNNGSTTVKLLAGETIAISMYYNSGGTLNLAGDSNVNYMTIDEVGPY